MGYGDLGCFGAPTTATPNIDRMAAEGVKLTQWYSAAPLCTPSRAGLLTGRLPKRSGLCGGVFPCDALEGIPANETTWAEVLQHAGWETAMVGKCAFQADVLAPLDRAAFCLPLPAIASIYIQPRAASLIPAGLLATLSDAGHLGQREEFLPTNR